jgi:DnaK suppressor protein
VAKKKSEKRGLTQSQLTELERVLREKREGIRARQAELEEQQRNLEIEPDPMDTASDLTAGNDGEALSVHDMSMLREIEGALKRMETGRYGLSVDSGEPIAYERLRSIPWARRTADEEEELSAQLGTRSSISS